MLIMKKGIPVKGGKTTEALKKVIELCLNDQPVLYINDEEAYDKSVEKIYKLLGEESENDMINNNFYHFGSGEDLEYLFNEISKDVLLKNASIVIDIRKDVSDVECNQDLYVYYQTALR